MMSVYLLPIKIKNPFALKLPGEAAIKCLRLDEKTKLNSEMCISPDAIEILALEFCIQLYFCHVYPGFRCLKSSLCEHFKSLTLGHKVYTLC